MECVCCGNDFFFAQHQKEGKTLPQFANKHQEIIANLQQKEEKEPRYFRDANVVLRDQFCPRAMDCSITDCSGKDSLRA